MKQFDLPIIHKSYQLYQLLYGFRKTISKMDRHTLWQRVEDTTLDILEDLLKVGYLASDKRSEQLIKVSARVDMLRIFLRLTFDVSILPKKKYIQLQEAIDEIGRMLGGWMKSVKQK